MRFVAAAMALAIAAIGILGIAAPSVFLDFARTLQTMDALYIVAVVRVVFGILLLLVAGESRFQKTLRAIGMIIIIGGVLTPFFGIDGAEAIFDWWSRHDSLVFRLFATLPVALGMFMAYALLSRRS